MLPCSRSCLKGSGRRLPARLDHGAVELEGSLLFLYPRWFATTARLPQASATFGTRTSANAGQNHGVTSDSKRHSSKFRLSKGPGPRFTSTTTSAIPQADGVTADTVGGYTASAPPRPHSDEIIVRPSASSSQEVPSTETLDASTRLRHLVADDHNPARRSTRSEYLRQFSPRDRTKLRNRVYLQRVDPGRRDPHWRTLYGMLETMQKEPRKVRKAGLKTKKIYLPEEMVALLTGDVSVRENVFFMLVRNGCRISVRPVEEGDGLNRKLVLTGSERAVEVVASRIQSLRKLQAAGDPLIDVQKPAYPMITDIETMQDPPLVRGVWMEDLSRRKAILEGDYEVPPLTVASHKELVERLEDITMAPLKPGASAILQNERTARMIRALLHHEPNQQLMSSAALNIALDWLCSHEFVSTAKDIFAKVEHVATADSFNLMLRMCAHRQDFRMFRHLLMAMSRLDIRPNGSTWVAFLELVPASSTKNYVAQKIHDNGYLSDISSYRSSLQSTAYYDLKAHLESGQTVDSFIERLARSEKSNWFTEALMSQMFEGIAAMKDFDSLKRLMQLCRDHGLPVGGQLFNHIISRYRKDIWKVLECIFWFPRNSKVPFNPTTYEMLFLSAFKSQRVNICRVLWRYACMAGGVTPKMSFALKESLLCIDPETKRRRRPRDRQWLLNAGKVIVGIDLRTPEFKLLPSLADVLAPKFHKDPISFLIETDRDGRWGQRKLQWLLTVWLIGRDVRTGPSYRPEEPLSLMLDAAARIDDEWTETRPSLQSMADEAIQVKIVRRTEGLATKLMADPFSDDVDSSPGSEVSSYSPA